MHVANLLSRAGLGIPLTFSSLFMTSCQQVCMLAVTDGVPFLKVRSKNIYVLTKMLNEKKKRRKLSISLVPHCTLQFVFSGSFESSCACPCVFFSFSRVFICFSSTLSIYSRFPPCTPVSAMGALREEEKKLEETDSQIREKESMLLKVRETLQGYHHMRYHRSASRASALQSSICSRVI